MHYKNYSRLNCRACVISVNTLFLVIGPVCNKVFYNYYNSFIIILQHLSSRYTYHHLITNVKDVNKSLNHWIKSNVSPLCECNLLISNLNSKFHLYWSRFLAFFDQLVICYSYFWHSRFWLVFDFLFTSNFSFLLQMKIEIQFSCPWGPENHMRSYLDHGMVNS
jgi:hypothetical protein